MIASRILRRPRVLIIGCGDVGLRCAEQLRARPAAPRIIALTSQAERCAELRAHGVLPVPGDLDQRATLKRLAGLAPTVLDLAPPRPEGGGAPRTRALLAALGTPRRAVPASMAVGRLRRMRGGVPGNMGMRAGRAAIVPDRALRPVLVYASTSGVYGDCEGGWIDETRPVRPVNARAQRRVAAERALRRATARGAVSARVVRVPGIYAANRLPLARLDRGTPALCDADDVYTNHIHADDLAAIMLRAGERGRPARTYHACDDTELKMGAYFALVARAFGRAEPPRITRAQAQQQLDPVLLSFMSESRRLRNTRMKRELGVRLRFASVEAGVRDALDQRGQRLDQDKAQ